jgi:nitric oxide reductase large subunit
MDSNNGITESDKHAYLLGYLVYVAIAFAVMAMLLRQLTTKQHAKPNTNAVPVRR